MVDRSISDTLKGAEERQYPAPIALASAIFYTFASRGRGGENVIGTYGYLGMLTMAMIVHVAGKQRTKRSN